MKIEYYPCVYFELTKIGASLAVSPGKPVKPDVMLFQFGPMHSSRSSLGVSDAIFGPHYETGSICFRGLQQSNAWGLKR